MARNSAAKNTQKTAEQMVESIRRMDKQICNLIMEKELQDGLKTDGSLALRAAVDMLIAAEVILSHQTDDYRVVNALDRATMNMKGICLYKK